MENMEVYRTGGNMLYMVIYRRDGRWVPFGVTDMTTYVNAWVDSARRCYGDPIEVLASNDEQRLSQMLEEKNAQPPPAQPGWRGILAGIGKETVQGNAPALYWNAEDRQRWEMEQGEGGDADQPFGARLFYDPPWSIKQQWLKLFRRVHEGELGGENDGAEPEEKEDAA